MGVRWGPPEDIRYSNQFYIVGDYLIAKDAEGIVDTVEWSLSFNTWCYRVAGKKAPFWLYQTDRTLKKRGARRPPPLPPLPLPDPIPIME
jgi:hypothetical protein